MDRRENLRKYAGADALTGPSVPSKAQKARNKAKTAGSRRAKVANILARPGKNLSARALKALKGAGRKK